MTYLYLYRSHDLQLLLCFVSAYQGEKTRNHTLRLLQIAISVAKYPSLWPRQLSRLLSLHPTTQPPLAQHLQTKVSCQQHKARRNHLMIRQSCVCFWVFSGSKCGSRDILAFDATSLEQLWMAMRLGADKAHRNLLLLSIGIQES